MNRPLFIICMLWLLPCWSIGSRELSRELRYRPEGNQFVIKNGNIKYNKALYGNNTGFRVETGDLPEFAMYLPGMGGNLHFGLIKGDQSVWLNECSFIESRYEPGKRIYQIRDSLLGSGEINLTALALYDADGFILELNWENLPSDVQLMWVYGGGTGNTFSRHGDLNADPADCFDLKPEYCVGNVYLLNKNIFEVTFGQRSKRGIKQIRGIFPNHSSLAIGDASKQESPLQSLSSERSDATPLLTGSLKMNASDRIYLALYNKGTIAKEFTVKQLPDQFRQAEKDRMYISDRIKVHTPDPFINPLGGIASIAGDAVWDGISYQHGAVGWRMPLNGWRGAYVGDVLGWHDRARTHFSGYAASQVTEPSSGPMIMDTALHLARGEEKMGNQLFSSGYICRNPGGKFQPHHYDMNLCYIDELLWHFNWTGDWKYVKEMWPVLKRHLAWEKRNFDPDNDGLYDAYACIWASDALQYSSGGVTHSSSYNYRANKMAGFIADKLGEDPKPYLLEAEKIKQAIDSFLWLKDRGHWAEYIEFLGKKQVHPAAGIWTIYHAIDSEIHDPFTAYQALRYVDKEIPHIPVRATGLEDEGYEVISTTNWMPYSWSVNNVAFAELLHASLAYWQGGRKEEAFQLWKSSILDAMYLGSSPGNIVQVSHYDAARGETYRDFADPTGMFARSMIQGLFGILPDALNGKVLIRPGLPESWEYASLETPDLLFDYKRNEEKETYIIEPYSLSGNRFQLQVPALKSTMGTVRVNGKVVHPSFIRDAIGIPMIFIDCGIAKRHEIVIEWNGNDFPSLPSVAGAKGEVFMQKVSGCEVLDIYDPQGVMEEPKRNALEIQGVLNGIPGHRTLFVQLKCGDFVYWLPLHIELKEALEVISSETGKNLEYIIKNNTRRDRSVTVQAGNQVKQYQIGKKNCTEKLYFPADAAVPGMNLIRITDESGVSFDHRIIKPELEFSHSPAFETILLDSYYNARISDIFKNKYLSPRSPYVTLQLPWQGVGEWCHPLLTADIDEKGLIEKTRLSGGRYVLPNGIPFRLPIDTVVPNIVYTSLWDNYPEKVSVALAGKASHAYLLMAGSTNHMQSRFVNGVIDVFYKDGSCDSLSLINPENWCPIEQDYYHDGLAFNLGAPRPWRVYLKSGIASRNAELELGIRGVYTRQIDGGAAIVLDMPLDSQKELDRLELRTTANEVIIGLSAITLIR